VPHSQQVVVDIPGVVSLEAAERLGALLNDPSAERAVVLDVS
jgi:hypothetical protein